MPLERGAMNTHLHIVLKLTCTFPYGFVTKYLNKYWDNLFLPSSKHFKTGCLMLCGEIIAVYCEIHSKHANTPYGQYVDLPNTTLLVLGDPGRLDKLIYGVSVETTRCEQASYSHVWSKRRNLKKWPLLPPGGSPWNSNVPPNDITCHLVAVCRTPSWECDIWIGRTDSVKVHPRSPSSRVAIFRCSNSQVSIRKVRNLPQISAIAMPHPTKFHIQG